MLSKIPLVMDLLDTYPDTKISDHVNSKMIEMYNAFSAGNNVNYSDDDICDYIKFINMSCMDINCYKHVASYINKNNIHVFDHLFDIYDILYELFPLLSYDTVSYHPIFNDVNHKEIKNRWIVHNITWIKRYNTELLEPYVKFKTLSAKYYVVGETVYSDHKKINPRLRESLTILYELERICSNGHLDLVKYRLPALAACPRPIMIFQRAVATTDAAARSSHAPATSARTPRKTPAPAAIAADTHCE